MKNDNGKTIKRNKNDSPAIGKAEEVERMEEANEVELNDNHVVKAVEGKFMLTPNTNVTTVDIDGNLVKVSAGETVEVSELTSLAFVDAGI